MTRLLVLPLAIAAFHSSIHPLTADERAALNGRFWRPGCPVALSQLRVLVVDHWGFDKRVHVGEIVVHRDVAAPLAKVFRRLYALRFPIRHMRFADAYGTERPKDNDLSGSFECRNAVPSPCTGGERTGPRADHTPGKAIPPQ